MTTVVAMRPCGALAIVGGNGVSALKDLLTKGSIPILLGTGGVGKTTIAAALALAGASANLNTAVITVDPSKRLRDALGLARLGGQPTRIGARQLAGGRTRPPSTAFRDDARRHRARGTRSSSVSSPTRPLAANFRQSLLQKPDRRVRRLRGFRRAAATLRSSSDRAPSSSKSSTLRPRRIRSSSCRRRRG